MEDAGGACGGQESELATLIRCLPMTAGGPVGGLSTARDELVNRALKEKSLVGNARAIVSFFYILYIFIRF
jgi:hypothetical protein